MRRPHASWCALAVTCLWLAPVKGETAAFSEKDIPKSLEEWIPWVLDSSPERECPVVEGRALCAWPGELRLELDQGGGGFVLRVQADREFRFGLPGDVAHWPQSVTLDGKTAVVLSDGNAPSVLVPRGMRTLAGRFSWKHLPEGLGVPPEIALVSLRLDGVEISNVRREADGRLWLKASAGEATEAETLDLTVMRKLIDAVPMRLETRVVVRASGKAREVSLPKALPEGVQTLSVDSELPARMEPDGTLRLQVRAGTYTVAVHGRFSGRMDTVAAPSKSEPWPADEVWVFQADPASRQVSLGGAPGIDSSRTNLPEEWKDLPAYEIAEGGSLVLTTQRRGEPEPPPDDLELSREIWLDLDGQGYTFRDRLRGSLGRSTRLDLDKPGVLGSAAVTGEAQLITLNPQDGRSGVELRDSALDLLAQWRLKGRPKELPAVGWSTDVVRSKMVLNLPPGYTLLGARGVDHLPDTWWESWDLFSFFFVLIMSLSIAKLTHWWVGLATLVAMVLAHDSGLSPATAWIPLLITLGLLLALPEGRLKFAARIAWWVSVVIVVSVLAPFSVDEVRQGLYPQIGDGRFVEHTQFSDPSVGFSSPPAADLEEAEEAPTQMLLAQEGIADRASGGGAQGESEPLQKRAPVSSKSKLQYSPKAPPPKALQQDPKAIVQTGHGLPTWNWNQWHLDWSGPVNAGHRMRLYLLGPTANLLLKLLEVLLVVGVTLMVIRRGLGVSGGIQGHPKTSPPRAAATAILLGLLLPLPAWAQDAQPSDDRLADLRDKLTRSPGCPDACVSVSNLLVALRGADMTLTSEVHAAVRTSFRLPGPASSFAPSRVLVNGKPTSALLLDDEGFIHVRIEEGRHLVEASGSMPNVATVTLELRDRPRLAVAEAPGWTVDGIDSDGHPDGSIQLARVATQSSEQASFEESAYLPFFEVRRDLDLGLPWLVSTTVRRLTPLGTAAVVRVPLLPGESVTESSLQVEGGEVVVAMGRDQEVVTWSSKLRETSSLTLEAVAERPLSEVWNVSCGAVQQCTFEGPPPVQRKDGTLLRNAFRPWPGEKLVVQTRKPAGAPGPSITVDTAQLEVSPGARMLTAGLELRVRTSRGGLQKIDLPDKASIKSVTVNGVAQPFSPEQRSLQLTLQTGSQDVIVLWQQDQGLSNMLRVPQVRVEGPVANAKIILNLPQDRWLLWAGGPSWGPAILFWGFLLTILLGSLILGRISSSPLKTWQWMLLGLGLTQVPIGVSIVIVGWFFALEWRARNVQKHFVVHNILQVVLGLWTLVAALCLVGSVYSGLAVQPDMQVGGNNSSNSQLIWLVDRVADTLPTPWALSVPLLVWKLIMLAWALWLAWSVVQWAPWAFKRWSHEVIWRPAPKPKHASNGR